MLACSDQHSPNAIDAVANDTSSGGTHLSISEYFRKLFISFLQHPPRVRRNHRSIAGTEAEAAVSHRQ
jgi:hypothetical protein